MGTRTKAAAFSFEEFYRAFGKSVAADAAGERVVSVEGVETPPKILPAATRRHSHESQSEGGGVAAIAPGASALDAPLPTHLAALAALQEADGSWKFSREFEYVINGVAPAPTDGISSTTWATCVCISIWRQSPACFAQLEASYSKAMLHCDDNVLRRVQSLVDFEALQNIRMYDDEEARAMRERAAKEVAARRALEDAEYQRLTREREEIELICELSVENARRLSIRTQSVFVKGLRSEVRDAFRSSASAASLSSSGFQVGEVVESCWRRLSRTAHACKQNEWHPCTVTAVKVESRSAHVQFANGDLERERNVPFSYLRRRPDDERAAREAASCSHKYTSAILFKERFHAFDGFHDVLVALMRGTTGALERIGAWKKYSASLRSSRKTTCEQHAFVWNGSNFVLTLSRSLDFLASNRELVEWYGDEFPLEMNPFMLSKSLVDRAEDMGLLRLHKNDSDEVAAMPTWWPEAHYDDELLARIARAETFVIREMVAAGVFAPSESR
ncbi:hypothetical protein PybrP1_000531 [[Pythium] brassicae (nom. inval.)]|nr:hypothetical protein PybrP1_000531 [[Pythium] brassicae (nom. inval.)]